MTIASYLASIPSPMIRSRAKAALETQVRYNRGEFLRRHQIVERKVAAGAKVLDRNGSIVLESPDGAFLDQRNITKHGLNYAAWLDARQSERPA